MTRPEVNAAGRSITVTFHLPAGVILSEADVPMVATALIEYGKRRAGRQHQLRGPARAADRAALREEAHRAYRLAKTITTTTGGQQT